MKEQLTCFGSGHVASRHLGRLWPTGCHSSMHSVGARFLAALLQPAVVEHQDWAACPIKIAEDVKLKLIEGEGFIQTSVYIVTNRMQT